MNTAFRISRERSTLRPLHMTPAINLLKKNAIWHQVNQYEHDPSVKSYGNEAADKLGIAPNTVFKTLVVQFDEANFAVAIIPVSSMLNLKLMAKAIGAKRSMMAKSVDVERITGYVLGGVSPFGQKKTLTTVIDASAQTNEKIFVSGGKRGLELEVNFGDLVTLLNCRVAEIVQ